MNSANRLSLTEYFACAAFWIVVFSVFISTYFAVNRFLVVGVGSAVLTAFILSRINDEVIHVVLLLVMPMMIIFFLSTIIERQDYELNYYISTLLGFAAAKIKDSRIQKTLLIVLLIQIAAQIFEWSRGKFLFNTPIALNGDLIDASSSAGIADVFRAKGLFGGPTAVGTTLTYFCVVYRKNLAVLLLSLICCALAYSRLGGYVIFYLLVLNVLFIDFIPKTYKISIVILGILSAFIAVNFVHALSSYNTSFVTGAFDLSNSHNEARTYYWMAGFYHISSMSVKDLFWGNPNGFITPYLFSTENAWMNAIIFAGCIVTSIYIAALFWGSRFTIASMHPRIIIFVVGFIVANFAALATCTIYWFAVFKFLDRDKADFNLEIVDNFKGTDRAYSEI
jgi:hypothetical protein